MYSDELLAKKRSCILYAGEGNRLQVDRLTLIAKTAGAAVYWLTSPMRTGAVALRHARDLSQTFDMRVSV